MTYHRQTYTKILYIQDIKLSQLRKPCRIHTKTARKVWARLWYLCRNLDNENTGIITLNWKELQRLFFVTEVCLYKWLEKGSVDGAFRTFYRKEDKLTIVLGSKTNVCKKLKLTDWGIIAEIETGLLLDPRRLKKAIAQITAQCLQLRSEKGRQLNEIKENRKQPTYPNIKKLIELFGAIQYETSTITYKLWKFGKLGKFLKLFDGKVGATQKTIGEHLNVTERTINTYLSGDAICQTVINIPEIEVQERMFDTSEGEKVKPFFKHQDKFYEFGPNLYNYEYTLSRELFQKYKFYLSMKNELAEASTYNNLISKSYELLSFRNFKNLLFKEFGGSLEDMIANRGGR